LHHLTVVRLLISNDDGVYSPGLAALARAASEFGEVHVVAPDVEQSSSSHSISSHPLSYRKIEFPGATTAHRVNGTPADCVALGMHLGGGVDVVLSGFNLGLNLGHGIWHSGTIAAAKQATMLGIRGIALSVPAGEQPVDFGALEPWFRKVLRTLLLDVSTPRLVNVNFPRAPRGMVWTRAAVQTYDGRIFPARDPLGRDVYWFSVAPVEAPDRATDRWAVEQRWISMTPLEVDPTDEELLERIAALHPMDDAVARVVSPPVSTSEAAAKVRVEEAGT
jgi:5'-nucleotidase